MRSLQSLSAVICRIKSGALAESSASVGAACASALEVAAYSWASCRGVSTSPAAARFRPTPSVRPVEGKGWQLTACHLISSVPGQQLTDCYPMQVAWRRMLLPCHLCNQTSSSRCEIKSKRLSYKQIAPFAAKADPKWHAQLMGPAVMCSFERRRDRIREAMQAFQRFPGDTGSSEVQGEPHSRACYVF